MAIYFSSRKMVKKQNNEVLRLEAFLKINLASIVKSLQFRYYPRENTPTTQPPTNISRNLFPAIPYNQLHQTLLHIHFAPQLFHVNTQLWPFEQFTVRTIETFR